METELQHVVGFMDQQQTSYDGETCCHLGYRGILTVIGIISHLKIIKIVCTYVINVNIINVSWS